MKRRRFLTLAGGAALIPALPAAALSDPTAKFSQAKLVMLARWVEAERHRRWLEAVINGSEAIKAMRAEAAALGVHIGA